MTTNDGWKYDEFVPNDRFFFYENLNQLSLDFFGYGLPKSWFVFFFCFRFVSMIGFLCVTQFSYFYFHSHFFIVEMFFFLFVRLSLSSFYNENVFQSFIDCDVHQCALGSFTFNQRFNDDFRVFLSSAFSFFGASNWSAHHFRIYFPMRMIRCQSFHFTNERNWFRWPLPYQGWWLPVNGSVEWTILPVNEWSGFIIASFRRPIVLTNVRKNLHIQLLPNSPLEK